MWLVFFPCTYLSSVRWLQERWGEQLTTLETRWTELISNILQIEMANVALEGDIERLRTKEAELADMLE